MRLLICTFCLLVLLSTTVLATDMANSSFTAISHHTSLTAEDDSSSSPQVSANNWITEFTQLSPQSGETVWFDTQCLLTHDEDHLYATFICHDPQPDSISQPMQRRDRSRRSDFVSFLISTFGDSKNGYYFRVTAGNVQTDGAISNVNNYDDTWDGVWESTVTSNDSGWTAELRIPLSTFRHGDPESEPWGVALERYVYRTQEWSAWPVFERRAGIRVDQFATLEGLGGIPASSHIELIPHVVGRLDDTPETGWRSDDNWESFGITGKVVLNPRWSVDAAYQPDFAQVDVDDAVINLSDYPVFLPEKRPFFLEGLDLFKNQPIQLVYTRRIADPVYGVRITGQEAALRTSGLYASNQSEDGRREDDFAVRTMWNMSQRNTLGGTLTHQHKEGEKVSTAALDATLRWSRRNQWTGIGAVSDVPGWNDQPISIESKLFVEAPGRLEINYDFGYRGRDFMINHLGWGRYSDQIWNWLRVQRRWFPRKGIAENYRIFVNPYQESHADTRYGMGNVHAGFRTGMRNQWAVGVNGRVGNQVRRNYLDDGETTERSILTDNFGDYVTEQYDTWSISPWISTDHRKPVNGSLTVGHNTIRDGYQVRFYPSMSLNPLNNLSLSMSLNWTHVWDVYDINDGNGTDFRVWRMGFDWSPTLPTSLRGTVQFVDNSNSDEQTVLANVVFAWNWHPGSWIYAVYREDRGAEDLLSSQPGDRTIRLKATWFITHPLSR
jgi:Domain of unknown function (DUF5916)